ncbi:UNKNOWN [Stylonychia lemnae]|uniref:Uncharacterized protein n=1 Tax=Stylonychia lemnae TaxID=5949 RepID=A0A078AM14_STYLE|nr:UNKNOWN [Stylonychia lemnae]|eukprot:CDW82906.1 UNKNOWN [Stylonychia lemnae]
MRRTTQNNSGINQIENIQSFKKIETIREEEQDNSFFDQTGETPLLMQKSIKESFSKRPSKLDDVIEKNIQHESISEKSEESDNPFDNPTLNLRARERGGTDKLISNSFSINDHDDEQIAKNQSMTERKSQRRLITEPKFSIDDRKKELKKVNYRTQIQPQNFRFFKFRQ